MRHIYLYTHCMHFILSPLIFYNIIQVQSNGNDCGMFAIAFAMTLSSGQPPEDLLFDVEQMRSQLTSCFEKEMKPFPSRKQCVKKRDRKKNEAVAVHCKCRLLESNKMVCCDTCGEWYHDTCVMVPPQVLNTDCFWTCPACTLQLYNFLFHEVLSDNVAISC